MKLKLNRDLHSRASACAKAVDEPLTRYVIIALKHYRSGFLNGVEIGDLRADSPRGGTCIEIPDVPEDQQTIREALAKAVTYAEPLMPKPFETDLIENVHYVIERQSA
jgi:hypothetical protein